MKYFRDGTFNSLLGLVADGGDYSFFGGMKNMWAGPGYWKAKRLNMLGTVLDTFMIFIIKMDINFSLKKLEIIHEAISNVT